MQTPFDWITMIAFAGLITLFLQRSARAVQVDKLWHYLPPAVGFAAANYAGNEGYPLIAVALLIAVAAYVWKVLKPGIVR